MKHKPSSHPDRSAKRYVLPFALIFFCLLIISFLIRSVVNSLFFTNKQRINIVLYGQQTIFFSLDMEDNIHYVVEFYPDMKVDVPNGYGQYRIGAIGKLVSLEKKPEIMQKTFSAVSSTFLDYYIYPANPEVYYGKRDDEVLKFPGFSDIMNMKSNASFVDKVYLALFFSKANQKQYKRLRSLEAENFFKQYQGYYYQDIYRQDKKSIQIQYNSDYNTAELIGRILEGNGIRINDYEQSAVKVSNCVVTEQANTFSVTARAISSFFKCSLKKGKTDVYDIIFSMGEREKDWEIN